MTNKLASTVLLSVPRAPTPVECPGPPRELSVLRSASLVTHASDMVLAPTATIASADGELLYELAHGPSGVHVTRSRRRGSAARLHCSALFEDEPTFRKWLSADDLRFTHPLVFQQVGRRFQELMSTRAAHDERRN